MRGSLLRLSAVLLIAFVAMSAQCVASCAVESCARPAQPPCHQAPSKASDGGCAHAQATGDNVANLLSDFALPAGEHVAITELSTPVVRVALRPTLTRPTLTAPVLRI